MVCLSSPFIFFRCFRGLPCLSFAFFRAFPLHSLLPSYVRYLFSFPLFVFSDDSRRWVTGDLERGLAKLPVFFHGALSAPVFLGCIAASPAGLAGVLFFSGLVGVGCAGQHPTTGTLSVYIILPLFLRVTYEDPSRLVFTFLSLFLSSLFSLARFCLFVDALDPFSRKGILFPLFFFYVFPCIFGTLSPPSRRRFFFRPQPDTRRTRPFCDLLTWPVPLSSVLFDLPELPASSPTARPTESRFSQFTSCTSRSSPPSHISVTLPSSIFTVPGLFL